jgi:hypothetical protein
MLMADALKLEYTQVYFLRARVEGKDILAPGTIWGFFLPLLDEFFIATEQALNDPKEPYSAVWSVAVYLTGPEDYEGQQFGTILDGQFTEANQFVEKLNNAARSV